MILAIHTFLKILAWAFIISAAIIAATGVSWFLVSVFGFIGFAALVGIIPSIEKMDRETEKLHKEIIAQMEMGDKLLAESNAMLEKAQEEFEEFIKRWREQGVET